MAMAEHPCQRCHSACPVRSYQGDFTTEVTVHDDDGSVAKTQRTIASEHAHFLPLVRMLNRASRTGLRLHVVDLAL